MSRSAAAPPSSAFRTLADVFLERPGVTMAKMFGCHGLRVLGKFFVFEWDGQLVAKLPAGSVTAHVAAGHGTPFDPGMGRKAREWLTVPPGATDWRSIAADAFDFVSENL